MSEAQPDHFGLMNPEELDPAARKGMLGEFVVTLIAVHAGFCVDKRDLERDAVDLTIRSKASPYPMLDFQVKCTHRDGQDSDELVYRLDRKQYDHLRAESIAPRFLAVLVVPEPPDQWLRQTTRKLTIRRCCYWTRMSGLPAVDNVDSVSVTISRANILTGAALSALMQQTREGAIRS